VLPLLRCGAQHDRGQTANHPISRTVQAREDRGRATYLITQGVVVVGADALLGLGLERMALTGATRVAADRVAQVRLHEAIALKMCLSARGVGAPMISSVSMVGGRRLNGLFVSPVDWSHIQCSVFVRTEICHSMSIWSQC
jgi:hypothetical protein